MVPAKRLLTLARDFLPLKFRLNVQKCTQRAPFQERNGRGRYKLYAAWNPGAGLRTTIPDVPSVFIQPDHRGFAMIEGDFNSRTLANMEMALDRVCGNTPLGEQYDVRKRVAEGILQCARHGRTTLGALTEAGERALARIPETTLKSA